MNKMVKEASEMYAIGAISLSQLAEVVENEANYAFSVEQPLMAEAMEYANAYSLECAAAMSVGTEVLVKLPYYRQDGNTEIVVFVNKSCGRRIWCTAEDNKKYYLDASCIIRTIDMCDE